MQREVQRVAMLFQVVLAELLAVVRRDDEDGALELTARSQSADDAPDDAVFVGDRAVVEVERAASVAESRAEVFGRAIRGVRVEEVEHREVGDARLVSLRIAVPLLAVGRYHAISPGEEVRHDVRGRLRLRLAHGLGAQVGMQESPCVVSGAFRRAAASSTRRAEPVWLSVVLHNACHQENGKSS